MRQIDGYVARVLQPGEQILHQGRVHWIVFVAPVALTFGSFAILVPLSQAIPLLQPVAIVALLGGGIGVVLALLRQLTDELTVTTHRVVAKFGFISRTTFELRHEQIEGVQVYQSILGRLLGYGTIAVTGTGGLLAPVPMIDAPVLFRQVLGQVLHQRFGARFANQDYSVAPAGAYGGNQPDPDGQGADWPPAAANQDHAGAAPRRRRKSHWDGL